MAFGRFTGAVAMRGVAMACAAGGQLLLTRLVLGRLGEEAMAAWGLVWQTMVLLSLLDIGLGQAVVRLGAERGTDPRFWGSVNVLLWTAGFIHATAMCLLAWLGPGAFALSVEVTPQFQNLCAIVGLAGIFRFRLGLGQWLLYSSVDPRPAALVDLALSILRPLAAIAACLSGGHLVFMGGAAVIGELLILALSYLIATRPRTEGASARQLADILDCGGSVTLLAVLTSSTIYLSGHLIGVHLGHEGVNIYQSSSMLGLLYIRIALLPQTVAFPRLVQAAHDQGPAGMIARYRRFVLPYLTACAIGGIAVIPLNDWAVGLWVGPRFAAGPAFAAAHVLWLWLMVSRTLQQTLLSATTRNQWPIIPAHALELALIWVLARPLLHSFGLVAFPLLQAAAHLLPIACQALRLRQIGIR